MGKSWDSFVPQPIFWKEIYRVLKPGGHLLVFGGTRTYDWMVMSLRFSGFEIRDQLQWIYGSGFPKSMDISKAIDKQHGAERKIIGKRSDGRYGHDFSPQAKKAMGNEVYNHTQGFKGEMGLITQPTTDAAKQWDGWGTALKPAFEPICLARKPISEKTVAENIIKWGVGAINIEACRIGFKDKADFDGAKFGRGTDITGGNLVGASEGTGETNIEPNPKGRWPANVIFDEQAAAILDQQSGILKTGAMKKPYTYTNTGTSLGKPSGQTKSVHGTNQGYASRFFYCAKALRSERNKGLEFDRKLQANATFRPNHLQDVIEGNSGKPHGRYTPTQNNHPTVKPVKLIKYLVRLITPPDGVCLDPFNGSGTTGIACKLEGFSYIGIEQDQSFCDISTARIDAWVPEPEDYDNPQIEMKFE